MPVKYMRPYWKDNRTTSAMPRRDAICAYVNFDLVMVSLVQRPQSPMPLNWHFPAMIGFG